ncbi:uncharacterized protein LOC127856886 isoform X3 [Dreissena polymorpha]|uniref:uncharacterized protein LOC127856886 isoform X3 n=1 Tax=Dreissena polymorpha TaxID=45954 RepID=UPI002264280B|nr:uncharacterized protein LOC127856886 isoform X3 [Dreissena polymorpha]
MMDLCPGTCAQMISTPTNRPRPPPLAQKPKPSPPKKPPLAAKPDVSPKPVGVNILPKSTNVLAEESDHKFLLSTVGPDNDSTPNHSWNVEKANHSNVNVSDVAPVISTLPHPMEQKPLQRPAGPPPPLPKTPAAAGNHATSKPGPKLPRFPLQTPPKPAASVLEVFPDVGSSESTSENVDGNKPPSVNKPPPPLPRTPPKGSAGIKRAITKDIEEVSQREVNAKDEENYPKEMLASSVVDTTDIPSIVEDLTVNEKSGETKMDKKEDFSFSNLKSKFANSSENISQSNTPVVPFKGSPKLLRRTVPNIDNKKSSPLKDPIVNAGKSTVCIEPEIEKEESEVKETPTSSLEVSTDIPSAVEDLSVNEKSGETKINEKEDFSFSNLKSKFRRTVPNTDDKKLSPVKDKIVNAGKSKFFVESSSEQSEPETKKDVINNHGVSEIHFIRNESFVLNNKSSVRFNKFSSPSHSPPVVRKSPPKLPPASLKPKPEQSSSKPEQSSSKPELSSSKPEQSITSQCHSHSISSPSSNLQSTVSNSLSNCVEQSSETNSGSDNLLVPKPVPRKVSSASPAPRPKPKPRTSISSNRNSAEESTLQPEEVRDNVRSGIASEPNNSYKNHNFSNTNVFGEVEKVDKETDIVGKSHNHSNATVEDTYKVIMREDSSPKAHITELDDETRKSVQVILRKKVSRDLNFDIQDVPSVDELKSIFVESDEETVEGNLPSNEFGFGDKFLKFSIENSTKLADGDERAKLSSMETSRGLEDKGSVSNVEDSKSLGKKDSFEDLLSDKALLEPTSLLNEIEDILTRSFKHSSLTRSGSSPEKKMSPYLKFDEMIRTERSKSVDDSMSNPKRPPRPKKEQKKLRTISQVVYDSCGSDTESLPDMSRNSLDSDIGNRSLTLGKAKPHPPKPKRNKLLTVQRSQSDVTSMKSLIDKQESRSPISPNHRRLLSDATHADVNSPQDENISMDRTKSWRKNRPTRKAPPPPVSQIKISSPRTPSTDLSIVVPLDERVKSMTSNKGTVSEKNISKSEIVSKHKPNTSLSYYHSIKDGGTDSDIDDHHDYQDIPDENEVSFKSEGPTLNHRANVKRSPPKLPPRNLNNSRSFDTSSMSSAGHDFDSQVTGEASSNDNVSVSSGCFENDAQSPGFKNQHLLKVYPKTSSPCVRDKQKIGSDENVLSSGLVPSESSMCDSRPVSGCSFQSETWSGAGSVGTAEATSSDSELDEEQKIAHKKEKRLFNIAKEIASSEREFVDRLKLLNVDFRLHISRATEELGRPVIPTDTLNRILDYLPQLQNFNEELLSDLETRISQWQEKKCIADIFKKKGPFLKLFSSYILNFENITATYDEALKKYPAFLAAVKEFEMSPRCQSLAVKHYMLKPIQRIPQYKMLLQDYLHHLPEDSPEIKDVTTALNIVSDVANHINENMRHEDYVQKMLEIQRSLIGTFEVIKPGRLFLKEGELMKLSRKEMQPRYFFLFNDVLLYTTPVATGYRLNNALPLTGMKVSINMQDEYKMEFSVMSTQRSFALQGSTLEERDDWVTALNAAIEENTLKRDTFVTIRSQLKDEHLQSSWPTYQALVDKDFVLGHKAPLWIPDARVTMCMICTIEFTVTFRRHHCRACGWVVCSGCSECKIKLRYLQNKPARVCDKCYTALSKDEPIVPDVMHPGDHEEAGEEEGGGMSLLKIFFRGGKERRSGRTEKRAHVRPDRCRVAANDEGASMSGYLQKWHKKKKWKKKWFLVKHNALYTFRATQDTAATDTMALLGYEVNRFNEFFEGVEQDLLFQLCHRGTAPIVFRTDSATSTEKWVNVMRQAALL